MRDVSTFKFIGGKLVLEEDVLLLKEYKGIKDDLPFFSTDSEEIELNKIERGYIESGDTFHKPSLIIETEGDRKEFNFNDGLSKNLSLYFDKNVGAEEFLKLMSKRADFSQKPPNTTDESDEDKTIDREILEEMLTTCYLGIKRGLIPRECDGAEFRLELKDGTASLDYREPSGVSTEYSVSMDVMDQKLSRVESEFQENLSSNSGGKNLFDLTTAQDSEVRKLTKDKIETSILNGYISIALFLPEDTPSNVQVDVEYTSTKGEIELDIPSGMTYRHSMRRSEIEKELDKKARQQIEIGDLGLQSEKLSEYIKSFVRQNGLGNSESRERLTKAINQDLEKNFTKKEIHDVIEEANSKAERKAVNSVLELDNPKSIEEKIQNFVRVFGRGNEKLRRYAEDILEIDESKFKSLASSTYENLENKEELDEFRDQIDVDSEIEDSELSLKQQKQLNNIPIIEDLREKVSWEDIEEMNGLEFERFLEDLFNSMGYNAHQTSGSGDQGADVIAEKPDEKIAIQAKRYSDNVSNKAIQEAISARDFYNCDRAIVVTNSEFTRSAEELAQKTGTDLWNSQELKEKKRKYL